MNTVAPFSNYQEVSLTQGTVRYHDQGTGPTLVFIHGLFLNSALWRDVIAHLCDQFRCIAPDLPLGGHLPPLSSDADLKPLGVAQLVADFLKALDLHDVTLVGNDTGGAICQLTIAHHPERIARLVLTNCDAFEHFFPLLISPLHYGAFLFGNGFTNVMAWALRARFVQRLLMASITYHYQDLTLLDAYFTPLIHTPGVRRNVTHFLRAVSSRYTLDAARTFPNFHHPVLIIWGKNDFFFSSRSAIRLQKAFPDAVLGFLPHSRALVPEDQPEALAQRIKEFVHRQPSD